MVKTESEESSRKARRKGERTNKKLQNKLHRRVADPMAETSSVAPTEAVVSTKKARVVKDKAVVQKKKTGTKRSDADTTTNAKKKRQRTDVDPDDPYAGMDSTTAAAMRRDDEEIEDLERKLGGSSAKSRLNKEYATLECYGDDFGDFLDDIDSMVQGVHRGDDFDESRYNDKRNAYRAGSDDDEDCVPMKAPAFDEYADNMESGSDADSDIEQDDSEDSHTDEEENNEADAADDDDDDDDQGANDGDRNAEDENSESEGDSDDEDVEEPDHDVALTYKPSKGEDIYGKSMDSAESASRPNKYVPPHLRNKGGEQPDNDAQRQESLRVIQRSLNSALNRLSEDTLIPVTQSISKLYGSHPTSDVHECIWENTRNACMARPQLMAGLIPVYVAALAGVHIEKGDTVQLGEHLLEKTVLELQRQLATVRTPSGTKDDDAKTSTIDKEVCNSILVLCYLYNYGIIHCSLIYDIIRDLIDSFAEIDVELLLLVLSHCGRALRSDDPSALKDIILLVQKKALANMSSASHSSRIEYMISAINDLKNNKRRQQDSVHADKTAKNRKILGRIKSNAAAGKGGARSADSSLRISVQDIMNAETKGRWWKVGASWVGNQHDYNGAETDENTRGSKASGSGDAGGSTEEDEKLLKLAAKYRMNTDTRRSIFCIIMGSADCDDSFEKLVRSGMLKNKTERETARVLMDCCGNEKSYNKFYSFLACKIIDYQQKCKFTFQLAFWDTFKQFDSLKPRKAANLAKLLFHLVVVQRSLKINVLKAIDMSSPDEMSDSAMIFVTIFLSSILEHFDDVSDVTQLVDSGISKRKSTDEAEEEDMDHMDDGEALNASLTVFFMQVLKASPKYKKGSKFKANLKAAVKACDTDNFF
jgi:nucleolar MIF4G domain-containing protein 1